MRIRLVLFLLALAVGLQAQVIYRQDFGGNKPTDDSISTVIFKDCKYRQVFNNDDGSECGTFSIRKKAFYNGTKSAYLKGTPSQWYAQDDHTYPKDYARGYFLQVDGSLENDIFYMMKVNGLHPGDSIEISFWVTNIYTSYQKYLFEEKHWPVAMPDIDVIVLNKPNLESEIGRFRMGPVPFSERLRGHTDYECSNDWINYKFRMRLPAQTTVLYIGLGNRQTGSPGNDFGIDDISVRVIKSGK